MPTSTYDIVRYWLPLVTAGTLVVKAYLSAKKSVGEWAEKLLNNHLAHIETNTAEAASLLKEVRDKQDEALKDLAILKDR